MPVLTSTEKSNYDSAYSWGNHAIQGYMKATDLSTDNIFSQNTIGNPSLKYIDKIMNMQMSSGVVTGADITNNLDGTVSLTASEALIRSGSNDIDPIVSVEIAEQLNIPITDLATNYIYIDYNAGNPVYTTTLNQNNIDCKSKCLAYIVYRNGTHLNIIDDRGHSTDVSRKTRHVFRAYSRFIHEEGGTELSEPSPLALAVTAGNFYYTVSAINHPAFDTSVAGTANENVFELMYRDGLGGWTSVVEQKLINTTTYDDGTGVLGTISNSKFGISWVYMIHNDPSHLVVIPAQQVYDTIGDTEVASPPSILPEVIGTMGSLIGYVTYQESDTSFINIFSAFTQTFSASQATIHNGLSGLQGGTINEYYHLTAEEYDRVIADVNVQTGTTYTAVLTDADDVITLNNASAITFTIPDNATVAFPVGTELELIQLGAGAVSIVISGTDTLNYNTIYTNSIKGQYSKVTLRKITSTSWILSGDLALV